MEKFLVRKVKSLHRGMAVNALIVQCSCCREWLILGELVSSILPYCSAQLLVELMHGKADISVASSQ
jgi:hypothetical protein